MKVLVTGAGGQLGTDVVDALSGRVPAGGLTGDPATGRLGPRLIDIQRPAIHIRAIQRGNGAIAFAIVMHLDEGKPTRLSCIAVRHNIDAIHHPLRMNRAAARAHLVGHMLP